MEVGGSDMGGYVGWDDTLVLVGRFILIALYKEMKVSAGYMDNHIHWQLVGTCSLK